MLGLKRREWLIRSFICVCIIWACSGAGAQAQTSDDRPSSDGTTNVAPPSQIPNVTLVKAGPAQVPTDKPFAFTLTVANTGTSAAPNVVVVDELALLLVHTGSSIVETGEACTEEDPDNDGLYDITCTIGTLNPGEQKTMTIGVQGIPLAPGTINNTAVAYANGQPVFTSNTLTTELLPANSPVLEGVYAGPASVAVGDEYDYTLVVSNTGTGNASNTNIRSNIPPTLTYVSATVTGGGACGYPVDFDEDGVGEVLCNFGTLAADAQETATIRVKATTEGTAEMVASLGLFGGQERVSSNTITTQIQTPATLSAQKIGPTLAGVNETFVYKLVVTNTGASTATNVVVEDDFNTGLQIQGAPTTTAGSCDVTNTTLSCALGTLAAGRSDTVSVSVRASAAASIENVFRVRADGVGEMMSNTVTTQVQTPTLAVTKEGPATATVGTPFSYSITVANTGAVNASDIAISDVLSDRLGFPIATVAAPATCRLEDLNANLKEDVFCEIPELAPSEQTIITILVQAEQTGTVQNVAQASAGGVEVTSNTVETSILAAPALSIQKKAPAEWGINSSIVYTLVVTNTGGSPANNVVLSDQFDNRLTVSTDATFQSKCSLSSSNVATCNMGTINAGASDSLFIIASSAEVASIQNSFSAVADGVEAVESNTVVTQVKAPSLLLGKKGPTDVVEGQSYTYTLTLANTGTVRATSITIEDRLSEFVRYKSATVTDTSGTVGRGFCENKDLNADSFSDMTCSVGAVLAGTSVVVTLEVTAVKTGTFENVAEAKGSLVNVTSNTVATTIHGMTTLSVTKEGPATVTVDSTITYQFNVKNTGSQAAIDVSVVDPLQTNILAFASGTDCVAAPAVAGVSVVTCAVGNLAPGQEKTISFVAQVQAAVGTRFENSALAKAANANEAESNTVATQVQSPSSLTLLKQGPAKVSVNETFAYTLIVTNNGPGTVANVVVEDAFATPLQVQAAATTTAGSCSVTDTTLSCMLGTLAEGRSDTIVVSVRSAVAATIENVFRVRADGIGEQASNAVVTQVQTAPILKAEKVASSVVAVGGQVGYRLIITNTGGSDAENVTVRDLLHPKLDVRVFVNVTGIGEVELPFSVADGNIFTANLGTFKPGQSDTLFIGTLSSLDFVGSIENMFTVSADGVGPIESNTVITEVKAPSLLLGKQGPEHVSEGQTYTYTLTLSNIGTVDAIQTIIQDRLPGLLRYKSYTISHGQCSPKDLDGDTENDLECIVVSLEPGQKSVITLEVTALRTGTVENVAEANFGPGKIASNAVTTSILGITTSLSVTKEGPATANPDSTITYQFKVKNTGSQEAVDVFVADLLPANLLAFFSGTDCIEAPVQTDLFLVTCAVGNLAVGQEKTISFVAQVQAGVGSRIENSALAQAVNANGVESNTVNTEVRALARPVSVSDTVVPAGGTVSHTLPPSGMAAYSCYLQLPSHPVVASGNATVTTVNAGDNLPSGLEDLGAALGELYRVDVPPGSESVQLDNIDGIPGLHTTRSACGSRDTGFDDKVRYIGVLDANNRLIVDWTVESLRAQSEAASQLSAMVNGNIDQGDVPLNMTFVGGMEPVLLSSGFVFNRPVQIEGQSSSATGMVIFDGSNCQTSCNGVTLRGGNSRLSRLYVRHYAGYGVAIEGQGNTRLTNNEFSNNGTGGIHIQNADDNQVGSVNGTGNNASGKNSSSNLEAGNIISGNQGPGIWIESGMGNTVLANHFDGNTGLGIDLGEVGWSTNDTEDSDIGANGLQNYPVLEQVLGGASGTTIEGQLEGAPSSTYTLAFYASPACHASGSGEGVHFLGLGTMSTGEGGMGPFALTVDGVVDIGHVVTATATNSEGDTSEFSACFTVQTGVATEAETMPTSFVLHQNYPNPFNPVTTITFDLPQHTHVIITVIDVLGHTVRTLVDRPLNSGRHSVAFDASGLSSGLYFYQVTLPHAQQMKHMVLLK